MCFCENLIVQNLYRPEPLSSHNHGNSAQAIVPSQSSDQTMKEPAMQSVNQTLIVIDFMFVQCNSIYTVRRQK